MENLLKSSFYYVRNFNWNDTGIISGIGMGGGTVLIFLLTFMLGIEQHIAQGANLIFFIPTSIVAIIVNFKNKNIDLKSCNNNFHFWSIGSYSWCQFSNIYKCKRFKEIFSEFF